MRTQEKVKEVSISFLAPVKIRLFPIRGEIWATLAKMNLAFEL